MPINSREGNLSALPVESGHCPLCKSRGLLLYDQLSDRLFGTKKSWRLLQCFNKNCAHAWIDPMPSDDELSKAYENYYTHVGSEGDDSWLRKKYKACRSAYLATEYGYDASNVGFIYSMAGRLITILMPHRKAAFDSSVMWLPAIRGGRVLEIGCGRGELIANLDSLGWEVVGIEPDPKSGAIATKRGLSVRIEELSYDSFDSNSFDAIVMSHVIEHVKKPVELLKICRKILKPEGRLLVLTPNIGSLGHSWFKSDWLHLDPPRHLNLFTRQSLLQTFKNGGFEASSCKTTLRNADWTFGGSMSLRKYGSYKFGKLPISLKLLGLIILYFEWLALMFDKGIGEELLATGRKICDSVDFVK